MQKRISPPLNIYRQIAVAFIALGFILILVIFYFSLTYAFIDIDPEKAGLTKEFTFIVQEDQAKEDLSRGLFTGKIISQTVEKEANFTATGNQEVNTNAKGGKIKIINNHSKSQTLVATTRFLTVDKILFRLKEQVVIGAGQTAEAQVYIDDEKNTAAVKKGDKLTIPGLWEGLQDKIYGEAVEDFIGDKSTVTIVSQEDIDKAVNQLITEAEDQSVGEDTTADNNVKIFTTDIISKTVVPGIGESANTFNVKAQISLSGIVFDKEKIENYALSLLQSSLTEDQEILEFDKNITFEVEKFNLDNKIVQIKGKVVGISIIRENSLVLDKSKLVKLSAAETEAYLKNLDGIKKAEVKFFPFWARRVPNFEDHIIIRINK